MRLPRLRPSFLSLASLVSPVSFVALLPLVGCSGAPAAAGLVDGGTLLASDGGPDNPGDSATLSDGSVGCVSAACSLDGSALGDGGAILTANQAGRTGADLLLTLEATADAKTTFGLDLLLRDQAGSPVVAFSGWNGVATDSERVVLFDNVPPADPQHPTRTVTLKGMIRAFPTIRAVDWALAGVGKNSTPATAKLVVQTIRALGQSCDPNVIASRCAPSLTCDCATATCAQASPPSLAQFAYLDSPAGGRMLLAGTDPADDLSSVHFEFLTPAGTPIGVDLNGNGDLSTAVDQPALGASVRGHFFFANQSSPTFAGVVARLAATPSGGATGPGDRVTATLQPTPTAATGEACDVRGFVGCATGDVCIGNVCETVAAAQEDAAQSAPVLDPASASVFATGYAQGASLWGDPPPGCAPIGVRGFPEAIVLLHLAADAPRLTITTDHPETTVGTAVFVLAGTGARVEGSPLGCRSGLPATVTLTNVLAADYTIVIESLSLAGGNFAVSLR